MFRYPPQQLVVHALQHIVHVGFGLEADSKMLVASPTLDA